MDVDDTYAIEDPLLYQKLKALHVGGFPGVYHLHVADKSGALLSVPRLIGTDPRGVLYIGTSSAVPNRVGAMRKSLSTAYKVLAPDLYGHLPYDDPGPHQTGRKIMRVGERFVRLFPFQNLRLTVERYYAERPAGASVDVGYYMLEDRKLREYESEFGERPPLNG